MMQAESLRRFHSHQNNPYLNSSVYKNESILSRSNTDLVFMGPFRKLNHRSNYTLNMIEMGGRERKHEFS